MQNRGNIEEQTIGYVARPGMIDVVYTRDKAVESVISQQGGLIYKDL